MTKSSPLNVPDKPPRAFAKTVERCVDSFSVKMPTIQHHPFFFLCGRALFLLRNDFISFSLHCQTIHHIFHARLQKLNFLWSMDFLQTKSQSVINQNMIQPDLNSEQNQQWNSIFYSQAPVSLEFVPRWHYVRQNP